MVKTQFLKTQQVQPPLVGSNPFAKLIGSQSEPIHYKDILNQKGQPEIFYSILGFYPDLSKRYLSLFRIDDKKAGCRFQWKGDMLYFVDNAGHAGKVFFNCFETAMYLHNLSFSEAVKYIASRLHVKPEEYIKRQALTISSPVDIRFTYRSWNQSPYFRNLFITPRQLASENVYLVADYWCNTRTTKTLVKNRFSSPKTNLCIAYYFPDSDHVKLYFPYADDNKWFSNCNADDIWGLNKLNNGKDLIITKSAKDYLVTKYVAGIPCIAVQNEGCYIKKDILVDLQDRYENIYLLFDNDDPGKQASEKLCNKYNFIPIFIPVRLGKDITEALESLQSRNKLKNLMTNIINNE